MSFTNIPTELQNAILSRVDIDLLIRLADLFSNKKDLQKIVQKNIVPYLRIQDKKKVLGALKVKFSHNGVMHPQNPLIFPELTSLYRNLLSKDPLTIRDAYVSEKVLKIYLSKYTFKICKYKDYTIFYSDHPLYKKRAHVYIHGSDIHVTCVYVSCKQVPQMMYVGTIAGRSMYRLNKYKNDKDITEVKSFDNQSWSLEMHKYLNYDRLDVYPESLDQGDGVFYVNNYLPDFKRIENTNIRAVRNRNVDIFGVMDVDRFVLEHNNVRIPIVKDGQFVLDNDTRTRYYS